MGARINNKKRQQLQLLVWAMVLVAILQVDIRIAAVV
jgi:hypothetical protein